MFKIRYLGKSVMRVSLLSTSHALRVTPAGHKDYYLHCLDSFLQFIEDLILWKYKKNNYVFLGRKRNEHIGLIYANICTTVGDFLNSKKKSKFPLHFIRHSSLIHLIRGKWTVVEFEKELKTRLAISFKVSFGFLFQSRN